MSPAAGTPREPLSLGLPGHAAATDPIARANITRAAIVFATARLQGELASERKTRRLIRHGEDQEMGKTKDIRETVEAELTFDPLVDPANITVVNMNGDVALNVTVPDGVEATAADGNLRLTGTVTYGAQRAAAESAVAGLTGVRGIRDDIEISYDADPVDVSFLVQEALDRYALVPDDSDVAVGTMGNTVTLNGSVRTWAEHDAVIDAAWRATGVYDVRDDLYITG